MNQSTVAGFVPYAAAMNRDLDEIIVVDTADGFAVPQPRAGTLQLFADGFESGDTSVWSATVPEKKLSIDGPIRRPPTRIVALPGGAPRHQQR